MSGFSAVLGRELRAYFFSPLGYVVMTLLLLVNGGVFWIIMSFLNDPRAPGGSPGAPLEYFFGQTLYFWLVLLVMAPALTMRLLSEERRSGSIEPLMTAPVTEVQVVLGKFAAALIFYIVLWLPTVTYAGILAYHSDIDWGPVAAGYLGILGIGALFLAVGVFASSLSRNQLIAAIVAFAILIVLFSFGLLENLFNSEITKEALGYMNLWQHMEDFSKGIVDSRALVYYLTATIFFLFLSSRALEANKWR